MRVCFERMMIINFRDTFAMEEIVYLNFNELTNYCISSMAVNGSILVHYCRFTASCSMIQTVKNMIPIFFFSFFFDWLVEQGTVFSRFRTALVKHWKFTFAMFFHN